MQARFNKVIKTLGIVLLVGVLYLIWCRVTNIHIPCLFKMRTGLYCPGCGITDVFVELSRFNFTGAFQHNPMVVTLMPVWAVLAFDILRSYIVSGQIKINKLETIVLWLSISCLLVFFVIRNIENYKYFFNKIINLINFIAKIPSFIFRL